ncbi:MAG: hypothetical protein O6940_01800 [Ignavibacteria bacterium]|nr:hypothetical protein [Ignavibacteria bacterium]
MKFPIIIVTVLISLNFLSCDVADLLNEPSDGKITAKEKLGEVMDKARSDFSQDAQLASIYGREVNTDGEIDLLNTTSFNVFIYVMQSDSLQSNEFYVPVFKAGPVRSPVNFETMLSLIKNSTAKNVMETVFGTLATVSIDPSASYSDSPEVLNILLPRPDVTAFRNINPTSMIDMFLVPGKSIDTTNVINSADWIVNFYSDTSSIVLWINSASGAVKNLSEL